VKWAGRYPIPNDETSFALFDSRIRLLTVSETEQAEGLVLVRVKDVVTWPEFDGLWKGGEAKFFEAFERMKGLDN
jgi:hypothetical protein